MEAKYNKFQPYTKVLVKARRTGEWFPDIYQRMYNNQHYVIGADYGYNDDEIKFYHDM